MPRLGKTAAVSGEVHRYGLPRSDLHVTLDGVAIKPALALGGWVAFAPMHGQAMVMGDLVLLETEINPVMTKLLEGGLDDHRRAQSHPARLAGNLLHACRRPWRSRENGDRHSLRAFGQQHAVRCAGNHRRPAPRRSISIPRKLDQIMGVKGKAAGGVYQFARAAARSRHRERDAGDRPRLAAPTG